ncbi:MAG: thiosulfate oxidation carrier complex protein SoxZ [Rhodospirillales bacterium]|nr:thiosulfate oxidation carrier complex protein SoxZ [Rhodospirillales bacterium]
MSKKPRVKVPKQAKAGELIQLKTLMSHVMETGNRKDSKTGKLIPRQIINKFVCKFNGKEVMSAELQPAIAANPYIAFYAKATESGTFDFEWTEDGGEVIKASGEITVS